MFGSGMLEVAIGLIFIYLLLSLVCTAINEFLASAINKRGSSLFEGVKNLLNDPRFTGLAQHVYSHGLIDGMSKDASDPKKPNRKPSYLPSATFALALSDILTSHGAIVQARGPAFDAAKAAEDAYENELWSTAGDKPSHDQRLQTLDTARTAAMDALKKAAAEARSAADDAGAKTTASPADAGLATALEQARKAAAGADAAVSYFEAKRAAIALAMSPKDAALMLKASATLETALDAGRRLANGQTKALDTIKAALEHLPAGHTKESLAVMIAKTEREITEGENAITLFERNVAQWFDAGMGRVSGWYKRWTQVWLVVFAATVVVALNADTLHLLKRLETDSALRASLAAAASDAVKTSTKVDDAGVNAAIQKAETLALPIGWNVPLAIRKLPASTADVQQVWMWIAGVGIWAIVSKLIGLAMTVLAVSLGAPFWFDTLGKIVNVRGAGTPPASTLPAKGAPQKTTT